VINLIKPWDGKEKGKVKAVQEDLFMECITQRWESENMPAETFKVAMLR
jgi:hypothetical protein